MCCVGSRHAHVGVGKVALGIQDMLLQERPGKPCSGAPNTAVEVEFKHVFVRGLLVKRPGDGAHHGDVHQQPDDLLWAVPVNPKSRPLNKMVPTILITDPWIRDVVSTAFGAWGPQKTHHKSRCLAPF